MAPLRSDQREILDVENYPFFDHSDAAFFLARRDDRPVGRIAAIENRRHNEFHDEEIGFFGFFAAVDDPDVTGALLDRAAGWVADRGGNAIRGPANYSSNESWGALVEGFDRRPAVMMPYNPPSLPRRIEDAGFTPIRGLLAYEIYIDQLNRSLLERIGERVVDRNDLQIRSMDLSRFMDEARRMLDLYVECWSDNWGFVPPTEDEFLHTCEQMKTVIEPDLGLFIEDDDREVGFIVGIPDANQALKHLNGRVLSWRIIPFLWKLYVTGLQRTRVLLLGVEDAYRGKGLEAALIAEYTRRAMNLGYPNAELSWILESNKEMIRVLEKIGAERASRYLVYERPV